MLSFQLGFMAITRKISLLYFILFLSPYFLYFKRSLFTNLFNKKEKQILLFGIISFILAFMTVILERKLSETHFSRLFIPILIIIPISLNLLFDKIKSFNIYLTHKKYIFALGITIFFVFSPFPRYAKHILITYGYFFNKTKKIRIQGFGSAPK